ncbi:hypothetical protein VSP20_06965 [Myroides phaeus]|uniref:hypothetical protein n=1 Tax=Myroides phaeus TaxID=702745 RepID=UPI002DBCF25F|nr:hypothetical protein [Myroides phaeus]MEC4116707.1 hypothetical protein [Myroides phaeus]
MQNSLLKIVVSFLFWPFFPMFYVKGMMEQNSYNHNVIDKKNISKLNIMYGIYGFICLFILAIFFINMSDEEVFSTFVGLIFIGIIANYLYLKYIVNKFKG